MKNVRKVLWAAMACIIIFMVACVTINIYFPAEKVESVAGEIVNDIRGQKEGEKGQSPKSDKGSLLREMLIVLSFSSAWAEEVTTVSNPTIRALKERMRSRFNQMRPYYQKGMLREGDNGYVSPGDTSGLGLKDKRDLNSLVAAENSDRKELYVEVAKALKITPLDATQINKVAQIFAREWQNSLR